MSEILLSFGRLLYKEGVGEVRWPKKIKKRATLPQQPSKDRNQKDQHKDRIVKGGGAIWAPCHRIEKQKKEEQKKH